VTGYIPDLWDGLDPTGVDRLSKTLQWNAIVVSMNTGSFTQGGLGRGFDWNNQDFIIVDQKPALISTDSFLCQTQ